MNNQDPGLWPIHVYNRANSKIGIHCARCGDILFRGGSILTDLDSIHHVLKRHIFECEHPEAFVGRYGDIPSPIGQESF
jgi:hypothetical protein